MCPEKAGIAECWGTPIEWGSPGAVNGTDLEAVLPHDIPNFFVGALAKGYALGDLHFAVAQVTEELSDLVILRPRVEVQKLRRDAQLSPIEMTTLVATEHLV